MKITRLLTLLVVAILFSRGLLLQARSLPSRSVLSADADWRFFFGDQAGAESATFDDGTWHVVTIPHDWSIERPPAKENPSGSSGGYFSTGIGWYRKTFTAPSAWAGKRVTLEFDGVSANATVFLNGSKIGFHPYAYTSFRFDITSQLKLSTKNVLAVRVDNLLQPSSRWYSGSGIYRHVRVVVTDPVHIAPWGVFVSTPEVSSTSAKVQIAMQVKNDTADDASFSVKTVLVAPSGARSRESVVAIAVQSNQLAEAKQEIVLSQPLLSSPRTPHLYRAITQILRNGRVLDQVETSFGVRSLAWSVDKGLLLNGEPIKLAGGSVHHDNGPLGLQHLIERKNAKCNFSRLQGSTPFELHITRLLLHFLTHVTDWGF